MVPPPKTPYNPYGPKKPLPPPAPKPSSLPTTPREFLFPSKNNVYDGLVMTAGILCATVIVKMIKKDMAPNFTMKNAVSLATVTILSDYLVDLGKRYQYIPYSIMLA